MLFESFNKLINLYNEYVKLFTHIKFGKLNILPDEKLKLQFVYPIFVSYEQINYFYKNNNIDKFVSRKSEHFINRAIPLIKDKIIQYFNSEIDYTEFSFDYSIENSGVFINITGLSYVSSPNILEDLFVNLQNRDKKFNRQKRSFMTLFATILDEKLI